MTLRGAVTVAMGVAAITGSNACKRSTPLTPASG